MSLVKLPFLVAVGLGTKLAYTPPNHAQKTEMVTPTYMEILFLGLMPRVKTAIICSVLAEVAAVILPHIPPSQLPEFASVLLKALGGADETPITLYFMAGSTLIALSGLIRWQCYRTLGRLFTYRLSVRSDHRLVTEGPYSILRHPSYTGGLVNMLGVAVFYGSPYSWLRRSGVLPDPLLRACAIFWIAFSAVNATVVFTRCSREDRMMQKEFGKEWEEWARQVKYCMIPGIY